MQRFLLGGVFLLTSFALLAQQQEGPTPGQLLRLARSTYEQGRLHEVEKQLDPVLADPRTTKQEKVEAYKLRCLSFIYLEEPEKADEAMLSILKTEPYFQINSAVDPAEFVALYKTFRRNPILRIGALLGGNFSQPNVSEVIMTDGGTGEYSKRFGLQFGAGADLPLPYLNYKITLHADLLYQQKKFDLTTKIDQGDGDINSTTASEVYTWLTLPITIQYYILEQDPLKERKYNPYVAVGIAPDLLLNANITAERTREGETSIEPRNFDLKEFRESINFSLLGAAGVKTRLGGGVVTLEVKFLYGLKGVVSSQKTYESHELFLTYGVPYSEFKLNSLAFGVSYLQNIFKPKKLTRH